MKVAKVPPYDVHPAVAYVQAILQNLEQHTGQDLEAWVRQVQASRAADVKARQAWLKEQGLGSTQAWFVAERSLGASAHAFDDTPAGYLELAPRYVDRQFSGKKAALRPLGDRILELARSLGPEIRICPCETILPIYRHHVIAQLKPFVSRLDLGLALGDPAKVKDPSGRLLATGGFQKKDRITHRLEVRVEADLDEVLTGFLRQAFERDQP